MKGHTYTLWHLIKKKKELTFVLFMFFFFKELPSVQSNCVVIMPHITANNMDKQQTQSF
jgi:hypothetical protein